MPTTFGGLIAFAFFLLPGLAYSARLERGHRPGRSSGISVFRETITVVIASVLALSLVAGVFAIVRISLPTRTPDVGRLVRDRRSAYLQSHYASLTAWLLATLVVAIGVAFLAAAGDLASRFDRITRSQHGGRIESAWWAAFELRAARDRNKYLHCRLEDGTQIEGVLHSYNHSPDETDDRQLVVQSPYYLTGAEPVRHLYQAGSIVLSARRIVWLRVEYLTDSELAQMSTTTSTAARTTPAPCAGPP